MNQFDEMVIIACNHEKNNNGREGNHDAGHKHKAGEYDRYHLAERKPGTEYGLNDVKSGEADENDQED